MKVYSQLEVASVENLASDPSLLPEGRIWFNTTEGVFKIVVGGSAKVLQRRDNTIIGTNATAANNVKLHRGANAKVQLVPGNDSTAEGTLATSLAEVDLKVPTYANFGALPAAGQAGRLAIASNVVYWDNGSTWKAVCTTSNAQTITGLQTFTNGIETSAELFGSVATDSSTTGADATLPTPTTFEVVVTNGSLTSIQTITAPAKNQIFVLKNQTGVAIVLKNTDSSAGQILTGTGLDATIPNKSAVILVYDTVASRWNVIGISAGSTTLSSYFYNKNKTASQSVSSGSTDKITWDAADFDTLSGFDNTNDRYTIPNGYSGKWLLMCHIVTQAGSGTSGGTELFLYKNGSLDRILANTNIDGSAGFRDLKGIEFLDLTQGDYLELFLSNNTGVSQLIYDISPYNHWILIKIA